MKSPKEVWLTLSERMREVFIDESVCWEQIMYDLEVILRNLDISLWSTWSISHIVNDEEDRITFTYSSGIRANDAPKTVETKGKKIRDCNTLGKNNEGADLIFTLRKISLFVMVLELIKLYLVILARKLLQRKLNSLSKSAHWIGQVVVQMTASHYY